MSTDRHAEHTYSHDYLSKDERIHRNEKRTAWVVLITSVAMIGEILFGYWTGSMALLADGWHMASHVGALSISVAAYRLARSPRFARRFTFGTGKLIPLGGYTSAIILGIVALLMAGESASRFLRPESIDFNTALLVSWIGLAVNVISAFLLFDPHHHHDDEVHDHTHHGAYLHVIADAMTSILAIAGLFLGKHLGWAWADPAMGIVGSTVILKWSWNLLRQTSVELLDASDTSVNEQDVVKLFADLSDVTITDVHVWKLAPKVLACEIMLCSAQARGSGFYRERVLTRFPINHLIIEERICAT
jgi:cation diffusion facilitator family transporter